MDLREALAMHPAILSSPDDEIGEDTVTQAMVEARRRLPPWPALGPTDLEAGRTTIRAPTSG